MRTTCRGGFTWYHHLVLVVPTMTGLSPVSSVQTGDSDADDLASPTTDGGCCLYPVGTYSFSATKHNLIRPLAMKLATSLGPSVSHLVLLGVHACAFCAYSQLQFYQDSACFSVRLLHSARDVGAARVHRKSCLLCSAAQLSLLGRVTPSDKSCLSVGCRSGSVGRVLRLTHSGEI